VDEADPDDGRLARFDRRSGGFETVILRTRERCRRQVTAAMAKAKAITLAM
jgi:hypothetical protein